MAGASPLAVADDHLLLHVRVAPRAGRDAIERIEIRRDGRAALRVALRAPPIDGEANDALRSFLADKFGVSRRDVAVIRGERGREKTLRLPLTARAAVADMLRMISLD